MTPEAAVPSVALSDACSPCVVCSSDGARDDSECEKKEEDSESVVPVLLEVPIVWHALVRAIETSNIWDFFILNGLAVRH